MSYTVFTLGAQLAWFLNVNVTMYIWKDLSQPSLYGSNSLDFIDLTILIVLATPSFVIMAAINSFLRIHKSKDISAIVFL
jgi:hypothetical protein